MNLHFFLRFWAQWGAERPWISSESCRLIFAYFAYFSWSVFSTLPAFIFIFVLFFVFYLKKKWILGNNPELGYDNHYSGIHDRTFNIFHLHSLLNSFGNPYRSIMSIFQCCYGCLRIVGTSQELGNLGSAQHHCCRHVESCLVSTRRETDESETLMSPLRFLTGGAANRHL